MIPRRLRLFRPLCALALLLGLADGASALSITLSGSGTGPLTAGTGSELALPGAQLAFSIGLDAATAINGYDVTLVWDTAELSLSSASPWIDLPFSSAPDPGESSGSRVAAITLPPTTTDLLFTVVFDVLAPLGDGLADVAVLVDADVNGTGISPGSLSLANPGGAGIDVVPEPASGALLVVGLGLLGAARRRRVTREPLRAPAA